MAKTSTAENKTTVVNGVILTPELEEVLKEWQQQSNLDGSRPEELISYLTRMQDFFCQMLAEFDGNGEINERYTKEAKGCIMALMSIKQELKRFIIYPNLASHATQ